MKAAASLGVALSAVLAVYDPHSSPASTPNAHTWAEENQCPCIKNTGSNTPGGLESPPAMDPMSSPCHGA
ncbi:hypothetical protein CMUS01_06715 [Colletotrichum musicola]|uniref:Uncharacterized protein n=1 Tax=Colletotrichum musicola TaxID=2175873 RepID=A0A8H6KK38_9PEZI|nr:hypothetical protein CMUS01_06715 [Colletotrichum musicola]